MNMQAVGIKQTVYGMSEEDYPNAEAFGVPIFPLAKNQPFPRELEDQYKRMQSNFATGIFPEISRLWVSIDSDLFLWNYENNTDLTFYDEISSVIFAVDLVAPKPGFTYQNMHFLLVVATAAEILLFPICFQDEHDVVRPLEATSFKDSYAHLIGGQPLFKLALEGLIVSNLCCTKNGRIFFSAEDCLYELEYYEKTWLSGKYCKKVNHSKGLLNSLVPVLSIFNSKDDIRQLEIDDTRHLLYVLFMRGGVQIFDLGCDGCSIQKYGIIHREQIEFEATSMCNVTPEFFHEIVGISAIPVTASYYFNFALVTSKGVRIYFTCLNQELDPQIQLTQEHMRPTTIKLVQIRFPPNEAFLALRGVNIYSSFVDGDTSVLVSMNDEESMFWTFTSSNFVRTRRFNEHCVSAPMFGPVWKLTKLPKSKIGRQIEDPMFIPPKDAPFIFGQHLYPVEKFYALTAKGIYTFHHLSPVEIFRQILKKHGIESKQFQAFAALMPAHEMCIMALIVMCSQGSSLDTSISDLAVRTFFTYGGEPQLNMGGGAGGDGGQTNGHGTPYDFRPRGIGGALTNGIGATLNSPKTPLSYQSPRLNNISLAFLRTSTPQEQRSFADDVSPTPFSPMTASNDPAIVSGAPSVIFSSRHDALVMYFQRILSPIIHKKICFGEDNQLVSVFTAEEIDNVIRHLCAFKQVIEEHSLISSTTAMHHSFSQSTRHIADSRSSAGRDQERQSLLSLRDELNRAYETLKLWAVVLEHDFNALISTLPADIQRMLLSFQFEELIHDQDNICAELITCIVRFYIGDDARTSAISRRLRESCPGIFTNDDALVVQATENLYRVKSTSNAKERKTLIDDAIATLLQSIQKLNLVQTCDLLIQIYHFSGIVDLALAKADRDDPSKLALIAYKKQLGGLAADEAELAEVERRVNDDYNCITETLELLNVVTNAKAHAVSAAALSASTYMFPSADHVRNLSPGVAKVERDEMLRRVFESDDELANVAVFRWLLSHGMVNVLLDSKCKFFEAFLFHEIEEGKGNRYLELLWKFYEKNENYGKAAQVLYDMAVKEGSRATLSQRITYLSQALICIQSEPETNVSATLKVKVQDSLDVAQIQLKIKTALEGFNVMDQAEQRRIRSALDALNTNIMELNDLYRDYLNPFNLFEIKLDALETSSSFKRDVIEEIWRSILDRELTNFVRKNESEMAAKGRLGGHIAKLRKHFLRSPQYVPNDFIIRYLLMFGFKMGVSADWLPGICHGGDVPYSVLLNVVSHEYRIADPFWKNNQRAQHFITDLVIDVCERYRSEQNRLAPSERKILRNNCLDFLSTLVVGPHLNDKSTRGRKLQLLQSEIERI